MNISSQIIRKYAITLFITLIIIFVALAIYVHYHNVLSADISLSQDLQSEGDTPVRQSYIYDVFYMISYLGTPLVSALMATVFALLFWLYRYLRESIYIIFASLTIGVNAIVKIIVNRPRPTTNFVQVFITETDKSFPSGHVFFYTVFFGLLFTMLFFTPRIPKVLRYIIQSASIFLIITISFSRVYLGVHWVTDAIGGYLFGGIILLSILYFYLKSSKIVGK